MQTLRILRPRGVTSLTQLSRATIYRLMGRGEFPKAIRLSANAVGWDVHDVHAWIDNRKAAGRGRSA